MEEYDNKISELVKKFEETITDTEYKEELSKSFREYLNGLKNYAIEKSKDKEYIIGFLEYTAENVTKMPLLHKKQMLIKDDSFRKVQQTSLKAFGMTQEIISGNKLELKENELEEMKNVLNSEVKNVREFNKQQAVMLVSEGLLDIRFVENPKTEIMSLRLGRHVVRRK